MGIPKTVRRYDAYTAKKMGRGLTKQREEKLLKVIDVWKTNLPIMKINFFL